MEDPSDARKPVDVDLLIERLAAHVLGMEELSATQIRAGEILLRRLQQQDDQGSSEPKRESVSEIRNVIVRPPL